MSLLDHFEDQQQRAYPVSSVSPYMGTSSIGLETGDPFTGSTTAGTPLSLIAGSSGINRFANKDDHRTVAQFMLDKVQFAFPDDILAVDVSNNMLCVALRTYTPPKDSARLRVLRIDLDKPDAIEDIVFTIKQKSDLILNVFLSPLAHHLIISCRSGDNYYLHARWNKPHLLSKIKGVRIRSIAWDISEKVESTGPMIIGCSQGRIFETELIPNEDFFKKEERYYSQVFSLHQDSPVIGVHFCLFPQSKFKYYIIAVTDCRIYQFIGQARSADSSFFANIFSRYDENPEYQELPGALLNPVMRTIETTLPNASCTTNLAWLTGAGLYLGEISAKEQSFGDTVIDSPQILPYSVSDPKQQANINTGLISFVLTNYHYVLLFNNEIVAISQLNNHIVSHESFVLAPNEMVLGMSSDMNRRTHWVYTNLSLYEIIITDEDRDIWKIMLDKKLFEQAATFAKTPEHKSLIKEMQAESLFSQKKYIQSAICYVETNISFETICLRFMNFKEQPALCVYLRKKLSLLRKQDITQTTLIGTWLLELISGKLCATEQRLTSLKQRMIMSTNTLDADKSKAAEYEKEHADLTLELRLLLKEYKDRLHHPTVYTLLGSHGRHADLVYFAELIGDWEKLVVFFIERREWSKALNIISRQDSIDFYYKHSSILIQHIPKEVIGLWMKVPNLNPRFLMPSMLNLNIFGSANQTNLASYLEYLVANGNHDRVIHNYLMRLYVSESSPENESPVLAYIQSQKESPLLDLPHALRICTERGLIQSSVQLYAMMSLYEEAIELALNRNDLDLARIIADKPDESDEVRKKLWLKIARHVISSAESVSSALEYLKIGNLNIEEILPFFPDFVLIDDFKDELCTALEEYNEYITTLKADLDDATKASENIRNDIRGLKNRYIIVPVTETCRSCNQPLMTRQFLAFPCQHSFHSDCIISSIIKDTARGKRILYIRSQLEKDAKTPVSFLTEERKATLKDELNDLISQECILCGDSMIKTIDESFTIQGEDM